MYERTTNTQRTKEGEGKRPHMGPQIRRLEKENQKLKEAIPLQTQELMLLNKEMNLV